MDSLRRHSTVLSGWWRSSWSNPLCYPSLEREKPRSLGSRDFEIGSLLGMSPLLVRGCSWIFHGLSHENFHLQRFSHDSPWFSHENLPLQRFSRGFPMIFPWELPFTKIFPWFPHDFPMKTSIYRDFPMIFPWKPPFIYKDFPMVSPWFSHENLPLLSGFPRN